MEKEIAAFFIGFLVGLMLVIVISKYGVMGEYHTKRMECEKSLPRDQVCVMYLTPEEQ